MAANNNNRGNPDPFHLNPLIHGTTVEGQNRHRREGQQPLAGGQRRPSHEISQPSRNEQAQNDMNEQAQNDRNEQAQNNRNELAQIQNNEADSRDGRPASSFTHTSQRRGTRYEDDQEQVGVPEDSDPTAILVLAALKKTNRLIQQQSEWIDRLERNPRSRSPPRRHCRSRSSSSSRSPSRRYRRRSPSSSRSPPKRYRRQRSYSRSPRRKSRKNQKLEEPETGIPSPEQDHRGPSKTMVKNRERSPPEDNRKASGKPQTKPR
ncbi:uncharacterized protein LOC131626413 [Vicia villosa]|uniref:uncharacterized protein LOC131626413 n=1 Tax=Vicia villosa TaxID=3911 RepID=UPI00273C46AA|nr:uncharacterized protein LOC131626413 [Vicia villosa]